jgi:hypothetical protein
MPKTAQRRESFLNIKSDVPEDLSRTFRAEAKAMPRARLGGGSWQFEDDKLAAAPRQDQGGQEDARRGLKNRSRPCSG